jgi:hypothetical protein
MSAAITVLVLLFFRVSVKIGTADARTADAPA